MFTKYQYQQFSHVLDGSCIGNIKFSPKAATPASVGEINLYLNWHPSIENAYSVPV